MSIRHGDIHRKEHHFIVKAWVDQDEKINFDLDLESEKIMAEDTKMLHLLQEKLGINYGN